MCFWFHCGALGRWRFLDAIIVLCYVWHGNEIWNTVTRAALCAGRGTAFARHPTTARLLKKRCRAEYRLPPQICLQKTLNFRYSIFKHAFDSHTLCHLPITYIKVILIYIPVRSAGGGLTDYGCDRIHSSMVISQGGVSMAFLPSSSKSSDCCASLVSSSQKSFLSFPSNISKACSVSFSLKNAL